MYYERFAVDFNVGIVQYEYNYPSNLVVMDDKTPHATENVTRIYWEHGQYPSILPMWWKESVSSEHDMLQQTHTTMHARSSSRHVFGDSRIATGVERQTRPRWDDSRSWVPHLKTTVRTTLGSYPTRMDAQSNVVRIQTLQHVQQVLPITSFGSLTVLHLPNKNYRPGTIKPNVFVQCASCDILCQAFIYSPFINRLSNYLDKIM
jgi:hypothetical protein